MGRVPMAQPPGMEIFALPILASRDPMTRKEALMVLTRS